MKRLIANSLLILIRMKKVFLMLALVLAMGVTNASGEQKTNI